MTTRHLAVVFLLSAVGLFAQTSTPIFPLKDVKAGMHATGLTVFEGDKVQTFNAEILGVVRNMGPRQSVILARLSGGPLAETGVLEGMSGSPVYMDGKLVGAVALGFPFAKTAIAGITPIENMIAQHGEAAAEQQKADEPQNERLDLANAGSQFNLISGPPAAVADESSSQFESAELPLLRTPLAFSGFSESAIRHFRPQLARLGLAPMLGGTLTGAFAGGSNDEYKTTGRPSDLKPGEMISVQLIRGDLNVSADGTVTYISGNDIYAFGHRFLSAGPTELPFTKASVVALMPGYMSSFKISVPGESLGVIRADMSQGIFGSFGGSAPMIPVHIAVRGPNHAVEDYRFEMVKHRDLSPLLLKMAVFATLDATQRGIGSQTLGVDGAIHLDGAPDIRIDDLFSGDMNAADAASTSAALPLQYLFSSGIPNINLKGIDLTVSSSDQKRILDVQQVWADRSRVHPGDAVNMTAILRAADGAELARHFAVTIPVNVPDGPLQIVIGEGGVLNQLEMQQFQQGFQAAALPQLVRAINHIRRKNRLYLRVLRPDPTYIVDGEQLPAPPPSLARALASSPFEDTDVSTLRASTVVDAESKPLPYVISGSKTVTIMVAEH
jgi:hypothetical protein